MQAWVKLVKDPKEGATNLKLLLQPLKHEWASRLNNRKRLIMPGAAWDAGMISSLRHVAHVNIALLLCVCRPCEMWQLCDVLP